MCAKALSLVPSSLEWELQMNRSEQTLHSHSAPKEPGKARLPSDSKETKSLALSGTGSMPCTLPAGSGTGNVSCQSSMAITSEMSETNVL